MEYLHDLETKITSSIEEQRDRLIECAAKLGEQVEMAYKEVLQQEYIFAYEMISKLEEKKKELTILRDGGYSGIKDFINVSTQLLNDAHESAAVHVKMLRETSLDFRQYCLSELGRIQGAGYDLVKEAKSAVDELKGRFVG